MSEEIKNKENEENKEESSYRENGNNSSLEEEIKAGEWRRLREFDSYKKRSRQGRIIATHQAISNRINQLVQLYYQMVRDNPGKAVKLLKEIKRLRFLQELLLSCLIWEEQGALEDHDIPIEISDIL